MFALTAQHPSSLMLRHYVIATAGHVDHGKSSLVKALTGTDPDRLPEEKARQITIDLGFAELALNHGIHAAMVDVPGHEDFVRNMIAGVGSIDLAILVVAADDGWMPQTEEHLQILEYLGVEHAVVALTKSDLGEPDRVADEVRAQLRESAFPEAPIIRTAIRRDGVAEGVIELKHALAHELDRLSPQRDIGKPRLFVDRAFTLHGLGTIVTGTLTGGMFRKGENVSIQPRNLVARIRAMQTHGREVDQTPPGTRTALNLPDLTAKQSVRRGDVVCLAGFEPTRKLSVVLRRSSRLRAAPPLKSGASVYLHHGSARVSARLFLREGAELGAGKTAAAEIRLGSPVLAFVGDRFVLRDPSERRTLAGGVIAALERTKDPLPAPGGIESRVALEIERHGLVARQGILRSSHFSEAEIEAALQQLQSQGKIFLTNEIAVATVTWRAARQRAADLIAQEHSAHPERAGLQLSELRAALKGHPAEFIEAILADLCVNDFVQVKSSIALRNHQQALPPELAEAAKTILDSLSANPFDPPNQRSLPPAARAAMNFLVSRGEIIALAPEIFVLHSAGMAMQEKVVRFLSQRGKATVSQFRQELNTSRRIIVPFLEWLDRQAITRRNGDERVLARPMSGSKVDNAQETAR